jgi:hypothetical protein
MKGANTLLLPTHYSPAYRSPGVCAKTTASVHGQSPVCERQALATSRMQVAYCLLIAHSLLLTAYCLLTTHY